MQLFNKFRETIFLKEDCSIEEELNYLKSIQDKVNEKDKISKEIKTLDAGLFGENSIAYELKNSNIGMYVLRDVNFEFEGLSAQIDYIICTPAHCYFVECKNMIGDVTINDKGEFSRVCQYNGQKVKEAIYSPYSQALRHIELWRKIWASGHSKLINIFNWGDKVFDKFYKPLVVFTNSKGLLHDRYAPKEIKDAVVRADNLIDYLKRDIENADKAYISNQKEMKEYCDVFLSWNVKRNFDYTNKYTMIEKTISDDELRESLKQFRTQKSKTMQKPAYYIFTNEQMEKIIASRPKNVDELEAAKILESIKLKCHGEEIVKIINNE